MKGILKAVILALVLSSAPTQVGAQLSWLFQNIPGMHNNPHSKTSISTTGTPFQTPKTADTSKAARTNGVDNQISLTNPEKWQPRESTYDLSPDQQFGKVVPKVDKEKKWEPHFPEAIFDDEAPAEWNMTFHEIVRANGFESEEHRVTTDDGYILTLHRIYSREPAVLEED